MMTYIIDNGQMYSSHALYFVEAPEDFAEWLRDVLVPWLERAKLPGERLRVLGTCQSVAWLEVARSSMSYQFFLVDDTVVGDYDYDASPPARRPLYRGA